MQKRIALHTIDLKMQLTSEIPLRVRVRQLRLEEYMRNRYGDFGGLQIWQVGPGKMAIDRQDLGPADLVDYHKWLIALTGCAVVGINDVDELGHEIWRKMKFSDDEKISAPDGEFSMTIDQFDFDDNCERVVTWALEHLNEGPAPENATFPREGHDHVRVDGEDVRAAAARVHVEPEEQAGRGDGKLEAGIRHPGDEHAVQGTGTPASGGDKEGEPEGFPLTPVMTLPQLKAKIAEIEKADREE